MTNYRGPVPHVCSRWSGRYAPRTFMGWLGRWWPR